MSIPSQDLLTFSFHHTMPRAKLFNKLPPFPEDVPVAELPRISLTKLLENNTHESEELFQACREVGFFLLDLTGSSAGETVLDDAEKTFDLEERIFALSQEELSKYIFESSADRFLYGYVFLEYYGESIT